jgi:hypothetical protein
MIQFRTNMKIFTATGLLFLLLIVNQTYAQYQQDNPNLDQVPQYLRESASSRNVVPRSSVITIGNWDNFSLGVDFAENNMAEHPDNPAWYFTAYNLNAPHNTQNGLDWFMNPANFGTTMRGDPVVAYDSLGNLFYVNMFGNISGGIVIASTDNGVTWGPPVNAIEGSDKIWIACDQTSGPYANYVYATMSNNGVGNFARSLDHGATFNPTFAPGTQTLPGMMVAVGPEGNVQGGAVYVVTNGGDTFNANYTFYRSNNGGETFSIMSDQQWANTVGMQVGGRNSVSNMRTRPYPIIAADNSYGANRGKLYCVYASNDPPGNNNKSDVFCRSSSDGGATWSSVVRVNDDADTKNFQQWHPAVWCDKETGKLYVTWMDTRDTPTNDSACIYASYSTDGGASFVTNQRISNEKMKIDCETCGGSGTPRYEGDYNGVVSNKKGSMIGWTDFRSGTFQGMTGYFPDFAMAIDHAVDTLYTLADHATFMVSIPETKLYTDTVVLSGNISPAPTAGTIRFEYPSGPFITSYPAARPVKLVLTGNVPAGTYTASFFASGLNGTPVHKRIASIIVIPGNNFQTILSANPNIICPGQSSQLNVDVVGGVPPFTYSWAPSGSLSDPTIVNPVATPDATMTYFILVTDSDAHTGMDSITLEVNGPPAAPGPIAGDQATCTGDTVAYSIVEVVGGITYSWSVSAGAVIVNGQNTPTVKIKWGDISGNVQVIAGNNCGNNPLASVLSVTVNQLPAALDPVVGPDIVCKNASATFYISPPDNSLNFTWTIPSDATIESGQGTDTLHVYWGPNQGDISVFAQNDCGLSNTVSKTVGVISVPEPAGSITGKDTVCLGDRYYNYSVPDISGATRYVWTLPAGITITAGEGTNQVTLLIGPTSQSGDISVQGRNDCGIGTESVKPLTVKTCTGIRENNLKSAVRISPNPVSGELTIFITGNESQLDLTISDLAGKVQYSEKLSGISDDFRKKLDLTGFHGGVYLLKLTGNDRVYLEKVIIQ